MPRSDVIRSVTVPRSSTAHGPCRTRRTAVVEEQPPRLEPADVPVTSTGRKNPLTSPPTFTVTVAPSLGAGERRDRRGIDQRDERRARRRPSRSIASSSTVLSPAAPPKTESPWSLRITSGLPSSRPPASARDRLVGRDARLHLEVGAQRPREVGQLVGRPLGERLVAVGHDDRRPARLLDVEPRLHREVRDATARRVRAPAPARGRTRSSSARPRSGTAPGARGAGSCARPWSGGPRRPRSGAAGSSTRRRSRTGRAAGCGSRPARRSCRPSPGSRWRDGRGSGRSARARPRTCAGDRQQPALDVVDAVGGAGAVEVHRQAVEVPGGGEAAAQPVLEVLAARRS